MTSPLHPPLPAFTSPGGREFTIADGEHSARYDGDPLWFDVWPILYNGEFAGKLYRDTSYGTTADGAPRWHATTRDLYWSYASDAPTGIGFDVAAFDSAEAACSAWARSADQILDWSEGKAVVGSYGVVQRVGGER
jgi:hypothetical protein